VKRDGSKGTIANLWRGDVRANVKIFLLFTHTIVVATAVKRNMCMLMETLMLYPFSRITSGKISNDTSIGTKRADL
jgi:hypothetical protein